MAGRRSPTLRLLTLLVTLVVSVALVLGFFGWVHPALDSFSHFRLHLAVLLFLCGLALLGFRYWTHGVAAILLSIGCIAATGLPARSLFYGQIAAGAALPTDQPVYKLLQLNVFYGNLQPKAVLSLIAREHPDVVTLDEVTDRWRTELDLIKAAYPHRLDCRGTPFSTVILSRRPIADGRNPYCAWNGRLAIAQIDLNARIVDVAAVHLPWPWPSDQAEMIEAEAPSLQMIGDTAIAAGDFNATPWSAATRKVAALGGFTKIERFGPTWVGSANLPAKLRFVGLPLDQVMAKGRIVVHSVQTLDAVGSDHLPVLVQFSIAPEDDESQGTQTVSLQTAGFSR